MAYRSMPGKIEATRPGEIKLAGGSPQPGGIGGLLHLRPLIGPLTHLSIDAPLDPSRIRRVLVTKLRHHGDVLLASPVLGALKRHLPDAEIDALVYHDTRDMLSGHPALSRLLTIRRKSNLREEWQLLTSLREHHYDLLIHLTRNPRGAWLARLLKPRLAVGENNTSSLYRNSFTHLFKRVHGHKRHTVENDLNALRCVGIRLDENDKSLCLIPGTDAEQAARTHIQRLGLIDNSFILIHPTSRWMFKCWSEAKVALLADKLIELGHPVLFTSGPDVREMDMLARIQTSMTGTASSLSGQLTLKELAALIARARLFIGVDSAPMHMAAALNTPLVALFGPSSEIDWGPRGDLYRVVTSAHSCRPCFMAGCGDSRVSDCLDAISLEQVMDAAMDLTGPTR